MVFCFLSAACFLVLIYPYVLYPLTLLLLKKQSLGALSGRSPSDTRAALLFCAYNEERSLPAKIQNVRAIKKVFPNLEVRVFTDGCTDSSVAILRAAADILTVHEGRTRAGKATGMRTLVAATDAEIVIFTDANVDIEPESISRLISYFGNPHVGTVAGTLHYTNPDDSTAARTGSAYWRMEETIKRLESETGSTMGADGSLFAMRRSLYPAVPANLLDDMIASFNPMFSGFRVISAPDVHAFERATVDSGDEFRRKRRIACRAYNTHRHLRPRLRTMGFMNRFKYVSHKHIRWFSAAFLLMWLVFTLGALVMLVGINIALAFAVTGFALVFIGLRFDAPVISTLTEIAMSILATGLGVVEAIAGRDYQTWAPARSPQE